MRRRSLSEIASIAGALSLAHLLAACGGPLGPLHGGRLRGALQETQIADWSFANDYRHAALEVRPDDPYSVTVNYYEVGGRLYLDIGEAAGWHRWRRYIREDPRVRVRFGDRVYPAIAVPVTDEREIAALLPVYFDKDASQPARGCAAPFTPACFPETNFVRLDPVAGSKSRR